MNIFTNLDFDYPWVLSVLVIVPVFIFLKYNRKHKEALSIPNLSAFKGIRTWVSVIYPVLFWIRLLIISLLIFTLARPRTVNSSEILEREKGIDIIMAIDVSLSMLAKDLNPDRLTAVKKVAISFAQRRPGDRIGLVAYSGEALTMVPLTTDRNILYEQIEGLNTEILKSGTNIGLGLSTAVNHLMNSQAKSKIIILMTDGVNTDNRPIDPEIAADIALTKNIKVYTIGVGTNGKALFPYLDIGGNILYEEQEVEIDETLLKNIAQKTHGEYFRATNKTALQDIYNYIDKLEKSDISDLKYYNYTEKYQIFLIPALCLLVLELGLRVFVFRSLN